MVYIKKAKEYAEKILKSSDFEDSLKEVMVEMVNEVKELFDTRNAKTNSALKSIILEQEQKWNAVCRIVNNHYDSKLLIEGGFTKFLKHHIPDTMKILDSN